MVNHSFQGVCLCQLGSASYKVSPHALDFTATKRCNVERNDKDAYDRDVYEGTEIEMSNYPALLTHIELSSCGQAASGELSGTESGFVNCTRQTVWKNCQKRMQQLLIIFLLTAKST